MIVDGVRTAMGKSKNGMFRNVRADSMSAELVKALVARNPFDTKLVEDVIWGCVNQTPEQGMNIGRNIGLLAELPRTTAGQTVNRLCGSSCKRYPHRSGTNHDWSRWCVHYRWCWAYSHVGMMHGIDINPEGFKIRRKKASNMMGLTAEMFGRMNNISRQEQDVWCRITSPCLGSDTARSFQERNHRHWRSWRKR